MKEDTCWDEHWVLYVSDESLSSIPEIKKKRVCVTFQNLKKIQINNSIPFKTLFVIRNTFYIATQYIDTEQRKVNKYLF